MKHTNIHQFLKLTFIDLIESGLNFKIKMLKIDKYIT
jgi:hypothetical protein